MHCYIEIINGVVVQLVRTPACQAGGRGFESRLSRKKVKASKYTKKELR